MVQLSGATQQSLAALMDAYGTHTTIEGLYLRFDVKPMPVETNKLRKATHLIRTLNARGNESSELMKLVDYVGSNAPGVPEQFHRGQTESEDFYKNLDQDLGRNVSTATAGAPREPAQRQFARPGTSAAPAPSEPSVHAKRYVFVVRGRDDAAYNALAAFLQALDLRIVTWDDAVRGATGGTPHTLDIVRAGIEMADGVIILMTPDDLGQVKPEFGSPRDNPREATLSGQARQNVIFEAGWAMALDQERVILVRVGEVRPLSDIDGLNYVWLTDDISSRRSLIARLRNIGLAIDADGEAWRSAGTFPIV